jgi:ribosomal protein S18 acetylase RimI-like enzyme
MAARLYPAPRERPDLIDLRRIGSRELEPLLEEETEAWRDELEWEFDKSADLVRRFVDLRALSGSALLVGGQVAGYVYYVVEDRKGLIGDLYVMRDWRSREREDRLLSSALNGLLESSETTRIESQLLMLNHMPGRLLPHSEYACGYDRNFMRVELGHNSPALLEGRVRRPMYIENWSDHYHDAAAQVIADAYQGHVDSRINDQYRSVAGARRFLFNIVQYPGCGAFFRPGSYVAFTGENGHLCGVSLASLVARDCGHITQICVSPAVRGTGIGYALLRRSLLALRDAGCRAATLTVTAANTNAVELYERVGFRIMRQFSAYAWEGF